MQSERRAFGLHPAVLLTLIREQAGSLDKALAELVMNSVDAGAMRVDITITTNGFSISDDGCGFTERRQLDDFFDIFGAPHEPEGTYYGAFRIGRGQIMSYAKTTWRSGPFEMRVDIGSGVDDLGYELITHQELAPGCLIEGMFYPDTNVYLGAFMLNPLGWVSERAFVSLVKYVPIPIYVNGAMINTPPASVEWDMEDEFAWYRFRKDDHSTAIFNRGVMVEDRPVKELGIGGDIVSKQQLRVNLARNSIDERCPVWWKIKAAVRAHFEIKIAKSRKLTLMETAALLNDLARTEVMVTGDRRTMLRKLRFIPDIFGELRSPDDFLKPGRFTLFDDKHQMVAERVQRQGRASVFVCKLYEFTNWARTDSNFHLTVRHLWSKLGYHGEPEWVPFEQYVAELSDTCQVLEDTELTRDELLALDCLRFVNCEVAHSVVGSSVSTRRLVAGVSDSLGAWTDGSTYIAVERRQLQSIRGGRIYKGEWSTSWNYGPAKLMALLAHEYAHTESSLGHHGHDFTFYQRFHDSVFRPGFGGLTDVLLRKYIAGLAKLQITVSTPVRTLIDHAVQYSPKLKAKATRKR